MAEEKKKKEKDFKALLKQVTRPASYLKDIEHSKIELGPGFQSLMGGLRGGTFGIVSGKYKAGKTHGILHMASKAQKEGYKIVYMDVEGRLNDRDVFETVGLDTSEEKLQIIRSTEEHVMTGEDFLGTVPYLMQTTPKENKLFIVMDSISQLCPEAFFGSDIGERQRDDTFLKLSALSKLMAQYLTVSDHIFVAVTHHVANTGYGRSTVSETGGNKIRYAADWWIKTQYASEWKEKEKIVGQITHWECVNSCLGIPGTKSDTYLRYNWGIDEEYELVKLASSLSVINNSGAWYNYKEHKMHGLEKAVIFLRDNPEVKQQIMDELMCLIA